MHIGLSERSYNIQNDALHYNTGHLRNGNQVLVGVQQPEIVIVEFDANGNYLGTSIREVSLDLQNSLHTPALGENEFQKWQKEAGFAAGTISVKQFFLPDRWIGIRDLPDHYQTVLDHPEEYDVQRLRELQADIRQWQEQGDFVLYWDEEYYLSQEGELESS